MIADINNATVEEINLVIQHFQDINSSIVTVNSDFSLAQSVEEDKEDAPEKPSSLATTDKGQLVSSTAHQIGIVLNASEIVEIATNLNDITDTFEQDIDSIKNAIVAFVNHKAAIAQGKINEMVEEVRQTVTAASQQNSNLLSQGLNSISQEIQEANRDFKSSVSQCLSAFAIPAIKAG